MMKTPLMNVRMRRRPVPPPTVAAAQPGTDRTEVMRSEHHENRAKKDARYIAGAGTLPGQSQKDSFEHPNEFAAQPMVAAYRQLSDTFCGEEFLDAEWFGTMSVSIGANSGEGKQRTREESWVHWCRNWGRRVVGLEGVERVGDMPWVRSRDEVVYWHQVNTLIAQMKSFETRAKESSLDFVAFDFPFDRFWIVNLRSRSYGVSELCRSAASGGSICACTCGNRLSIMRWLPRRALSCTCHAMRSSARWSHRRCC